MVCICLSIDLRIQTSYCGIYSTACDQRFAIFCGRTISRRPFASTIRYILQILVCSSSRRKMFIARSRRMCIDCYLSIINLDIAIGRAGFGLCCISACMCTLGMIVCNLAAIASISSTLGFTKCDTIIHRNVRRTRPTIGFVGVDVVIDLAGFRRTWLLFIYQGKRSGTIQRTIQNIVYIRRKISGINDTLTIQRYNTICCTNRRCGHIWMLVITSVICRFYRSRAGSYSRIGRICRIGDFNNTGLRSACNRQIRPSPNTVFGILQELTSSATGRNVIVTATGRMCIGDFDRNTLRVTHIYNTVNRHHFTGRKRNRNSASFFGKTGFQRCFYCHPVGSIHERSKRLKHDIIKRRASIGTSQYKS